MLIPFDEKFKFTNAFRPLNKEWSNIFKLFEFKFSTFKFSDRTNEFFSIQNVTCYEGF